MAKFYELPSNFDMIISCPILRTTGLIDLLSTLTVEEVHVDEDLDDAPYAQLDVPALMPLTPTSVSGAAEYEAASISDSRISAQCCDVVSEFRNIFAAVQSSLGTRVYFGVDTKCGHSCTSALA